MTFKSCITDLDTPTGIMRVTQYQPTEVGPWPALLFYSEIFQLTAPIERIAAFLAGHGYIVLVPEVFHELNPIGTVLGYDDPGKDKGNADKAQKPVESYDSDNTAMIEHLQTLPEFSGAIGAIGVCIGGHLSFRAALNPSVKATVCLYATDLHEATMPCQPGNDSLSQCGKIEGELLMVFGKQDPHVPLEGRAKIHQALTANEVSFSWHEVNAQHAFMRDEGDRYDPELARQCFQLSLDLFHRKLR